jgi:hypothetical protein
MIYYYFFFCLGLEHEFKLKSIIYHQDARKHFVAIHRIDDYYILADHLMERPSDDGAAKKKNKKKFPTMFRPPLPSDHDYYGPNKASLASIVYVRQFDQK